MPELLQNPVTVILVIVLAFLVFLAVRKIIKDKKSGVGACGQNCADCPRAGDCNKE